jgi:hypothetical protein
MHEMVDLQARAFESGHLKMEIIDHVSARPFSSSSCASPSYLANNAIHVVYHKHGNYADPLVRQNAWAVSQTRYQIRMSGDRW